MNLPPVYPDAGFSRFPVFRDVNQFLIRSRKFWKYFPSSVFREVCYRNYAKLQSTVCINVKQMNPTLLKESFCESLRIDRGLYPTM